MTSAVTAIRACVTRTDRVGCGFDGPLAVPPEAARTTAVPAAGGRREVFGFAGSEGSGSVA
ncbi:hypothetical protein Aca07nite_15370 [Actinoplanes capillaceus]|uniref:Uncharacterized protein n=1 Tax=Actinoplanes campanulatus TaxID=113559 RepID=A0ABQ3WB45_9ACTN|nr:hypothetical protein Aca07nite_15370 [Actinoplanes capillaceus]